MVFPTGQPKADAWIARLRIIWFAMISSVVFYAVVTYLLLLTHGPFITLDQGVGSALEIGVIVISGAMAVMVFALDGKRKNPLSIRRFLASTGNSGSPETNKTETPQDGGSGTINALGAYYLQSCVLRWAITDFIALLGFALSLSGDTMITVSALYIFSIMVFLKLRPSQEELLEMVQAARTV